MNMRAMDLAGILKNENLNFIYSSPTIFMINETANTTIAGGKNKVRPPIVRFIITTLGSDIRF